MGSQLGGLFGGLWGDAGKNFVDLQGGPDKVFGTKPQVADYIPTDVSSEQGKVASSNLKNADSLESMMNRLIPGWSDMLKTGTGNAIDMLHGNVPQDVQDKIMRNSAYQALQGGYAGSGMSKALTARDLGLTSLDMMNQGTNAAQSWSKLAETSYSPFIDTLGQQLQVTGANNAGAQATQQAKYNVAAAPDPGAAGTFALDTALGEQMLSLGMGMGTAAMAGGGGGGAGAGGGGGGAQYAQAAASLRSGTYNYAGTGSNGQSWQYNPTTGQYMPIMQAQPVWGGG